jgi:glycosyltransferase involved in cell wall biosynthesis
LTAEHCCVSIVPVPRLLLVAYYFPPATGGGVARALSFARHLPSHGWEVTVLCADARSAPLRDETRAAARAVTGERIEVPMPRLFRAGRRSVIGSGPARPSVIYRFARGLSAWIFVPDSFAPWRGGAVRMAKRRLARGRVDALLTTSPPDTVHLVGLDLATADPRLPWMADFRDPWVGLTYRTPPTSWHAGRQRAMRDAVLSRADRVVATTRTSADALSEQVGAARVRVLANGWEDDVAEARSEIVAPGGADPAGRVQVVYTGTLWDVPSTRHLFPALRAALGGDSRGAASGAAITDPPIALTVAGAHESADRDLVSSYGLQSAVRFLGQIPYAESRCLQSSADVLLLLQVHGRGYDAAVPGKLYEYIAAGRPIVAVLEPGEAADLVHAAGGWVISPVERAGMRRAFERLLRGERPAAATRERQALAGEFRRDRLAGQLAAMLDEMVEERRKSR